MIGEGLLLFLGFGEKAFVAAGAAEIDITMIAAAAAAAIFVVVEEEEDLMVLLVFACLGPCCC